MNLNEFARIHRDLDAQVFDERYGHPFLVVVEHAAPHPERLFETVSLKHLQDADWTQNATDAVVYPVRREGDENSSMVTAGRARNMDVVLDNPSVSKLHFYFKRDAIDGQWTLADAGSTNGTVLNGVALDENQLVRVKDGDQIGVAQVFTAEFLSAKAMYE